jgi:hypothetical protein
MPIQIEVIENGRIMHLQVTDPWKPADILPAKEKTREIFTAAKNTVHALVDLRRAAITMNLISASQQVIGGDPLPNAGQIAVVGINPLMQMMARPILKLSGSGDTVSFFDSVESAKKHLSKYF